MKQCKWFACCALILLGFGQVEAAPPEIIDSLSSKVSIRDSHGYFVLADGSCWKTVPFTPRWRSLNEWWNDVKLAPDYYLTKLDDWHTGTLIEVYSKLDHLEIDESDAADPALFKQCSHLLFNTRTRQVLFATELHPAKCVVQVYTEGETIGYQSGYQQGRNEGRAQGQQAAAEEYHQGYAAAQRELEQILAAKEKEAYRKGYDACAGEADELIDWAEYEGRRQGRSEQDQEARKREDAAYMRGCADGKKAEAATISQQVDEAYLRGYNEGYDRCYKDLIPPPPYR